MAASTVTTVGYGDRFPVTSQGRVIAVALKVVGIAMVGAITASIAAWMVGRLQHEGSPEDVRDWPQQDRGPVPRASRGDARGTGFSRKRGRASARRFVLLVAGGRPANHASPNLNLN
ncbi:MAG TPA: potassium channel family protein [Dermatophilaceae bacterium]|nr:potassium channel family protein [Dermatophilaceae bacterium]